MPDPFEALTAGLPATRVSASQAYRSCTCHARLQISSSDVALVLDAVRRFDADHRAMGHVYQVSYHHILTVRDRPDLGEARDFMSRQVEPPPGPGGP